MIVDERNFDCIGEAIDYVITELGYKTDDERLQILRFEDVLSRNVSIHCHLENDLLFKLNCIPFVADTKYFLIRWHVNIKIQEKKGD